MLDFLRRACELAGAARDRPLLAGGGRVAHDRRVKRTRAAARKFVRLRRFWALLRHHAPHLWDDVAGTLDRHRVTDSHAQPFDLVGIVQPSRGPPAPRRGGGARREMGGRAPVRPTWISIALTTVVAFPAGNLCAIAQRGLRETKPSRCCQSRRSTL